MSPTVLWIIFALYSLVMIGLSFRTTGHDPDAESFWSGGPKGMPWWQLSASLTAGWLMLGWIGFGMGQVYMLGATGLWTLPLPWLILVIGIVIFVPVYRRVPFFSIANAMESRFGLTARRLTGLFSLGVFVSWTGAELVMVKTLLGAQLGLSPEQGWIALLAFVVPIMIYTWRGGFRAIVHTDVLQFALMIVFMVILLIQAWHSASAATGGKILEAIAASNPPGLEKGAPVFSLGNLGILFPVILLIGYLPGWAIEQDLWLRMQATRSQKDARRAAWATCLLVGIFVVVIPSIVAFLALAAFPPEAGAEAAAVGGPKSGAIGIISALIAGMPPLTATWMFLGIIACQMSTVDTFAGVAAMALGNDLLRTRGPEGRRVSRITSVLVLFVAFLYALWADRLGDIYYISSGVLSAAIAIPLMAWGWGRAGSGAILGASLTGAVTAAVFYWIEYKVWELKAPEALSWLAPSIGYNYLAACVLSAAAVLLTIGWLWPANRTASDAETEEIPGETA
ncbi:MAG TPA: hypothetical protein PKH31_09395 [Candidatus Sumerlaeota bacterium]|nr:hypothetical protein [Candidatus Sumerlaeota bacterium]